MARALCGAALLAVLLTAAAEGPACAGETMVVNGDFEQADPTNSTRPAHWERPDGLGVQWTNAPESAHGKAIRMDTSVGSIDWS